MPNRQSHNGFLIIIALLIGAAVVAASAGVYFYQTQIARQKPVPATPLPKTQTPTTQIPTTEKEIKTEVKEPQNPPETEIAVGQNEANNITDWQTYRNEEWGIEFKYPKDLFWGGKIDDLGEVACDAANFGEKSPCPKYSYYKNEKIFLNGREFWRCWYSDGAAGSGYSNFQYIGVRENKCFSLAFAVRYVNCQIFDGADDPNYKKCETENLQHDADLKNIEKTFKFIY